MTTKEYFNDSDLSVDVFNKKYKVKEDEQYDDAVLRVVEKIALMEIYDPDKENLKESVSSDEIDIIELWKQRWYNEIIDDIWKPAGSIMAGVGNPISNISTANCTTISINGDSLEDIAETRYKLMKFAAYRQGIGIDFSPLRPAGSIVNNSAKVSNGGSINWMEDFNGAAKHVGQSGRVPALLFSLHDTHPDLPEFVKLKSDLTKISNANISVQISDAFMNAVKNDEEWEMTFNTPHQTIVRKEKAKKIFNDIVENNLKFAEPGIQFRDTIHHYSNSDYVGWPVVSSNACFTGDMELLTDVGYKRFDELEKIGGINVLNYLGEVSPGKVWYSGEKEVVLIVAKDKNDKEYSIKVTLDQRFIDIYFNVVEAKDLLDKNIALNGFTAKVISVENLGKLPVYDFSEPLTHWGVVNWFIVHNCSEKFLDPSGACNLCSINFEKVPVEKNKIDGFFAYYMPGIVRFMDNVIDYEEYSNRNPIDEQKISQRNLRRLGIGFTNLHAFLLKAGVQYGDEKSIELLDYVMSRMMYYAYRSSIDLGKEKGSFKAFDKERFIKSPYVKMLLKEGLEFNTMRNVELLAVAPSGSLSTQISKPVFSYGIEPAFGLYYWKRTRISGKYEYYFIVPNIVYEILKKNNINLRDYGLEKLTVKDDFEGTKGKPIAKIIDKHKHLFNFKPAKDITVEEKLNVMSTVAKYIDSSISTTYILPETATNKDVEKIIFDAWERKIKSVAIYRDSTRLGIIEFIPFKQRVEELYNKGFKLGEYELSKDDLKHLSFNPFEKNLNITLSDENTKDLAKIYKFKAEGNDKFYVILKLDEKEIFITNYKIENRANEHLLAMANKLGKLIKEKNEKKYYKQLERSENTLNRFTRMLSTALKLGLKNDALSILEEYAFVGNLAWYLTHKIFKVKKSGKKCILCGATMIDYAGCWKCTNCGYEKCE